MPTLLVLIFFISIAGFEISSNANIWFFDIIVKDSIVTSGVISDIKRVDVETIENPRSAVKIVTVAYKVSDEQFKKEIQINWKSINSSKRDISLGRQVSVKYDSSTPGKSIIIDKDFSDQTSGAIVIICVFGIIVTVLLKSKLKRKKYINLENF